MFDGRWRHAVDQATHPVGKVLVRAHITADVITTFGLAMSVVLALAVGSGHLLIAIGLLFAVGLPDLFDGPVAKASGTASVRGAFFDSVADRVSDAFMLGGVAWYLEANHHGQAVLLPFAIVAVTSMISYQRAKAELLGVPARGGLMERAERFILLGFCFIAGCISTSAFVPALWVFLGLVLATAIGRFVKVIKVAQGPVRDPALIRTRPARTRLEPAFASDPESEHSGHLAEVSRRALARVREARTDSRWRAWRDARAQRDPGVPKVSRPGRSGEPATKWWPWREGSVPTTRATTRANGTSRVVRRQARANARTRPAER